MCFEICPLSFKWFRPKFKTSFNRASANSTTQHISGHLFVQDAVLLRGRSLVGNSDDRSAQTQNTAQEYGHYSHYSVVNMLIRQDLSLDPFALICDKPCPIRSLLPFSSAAARLQAGFGQSDHPPRQSPNCWKRSSNAFAYSPRIPSGARW